MRKEVDPKKVRSPKVGFEKSSVGYSNKVAFEMLHSKNLRSKGWIREKLDSKKLEVGFEQSWIPKVEFDES